MNVIEPVLVELPRPTLLKAIAGVMGRYREGSVWQYLFRLAAAVEESCKQRRDLFVSATDFYLLMLQSLKNSAGEALAGEELYSALGILPQINDEILKTGHSLAEKFTFQMFSIAPMTNSRYLAQVVTSLTANGSRQAAEDAVSFVPLAKAS